MKYTLKHLWSLVAVGLCAILAITLSSCSKDEDEPDSSITGLWGIGSYYSGGEYENAIQFNANGTGVYYDDYPSTTNGTEAFTYTFDGKKIVWTSVDDEYVFTTVWTIVSMDKNKIVFSEDGDTDTLVRLK